MRLRVARTEELDREDLEAIRRLMDVEFEGDFQDADWDHAMGGDHVLIWDDVGLVTHASVVARRLRCGDLVLDTGYVEAVATRLDQRRRGHGSRAMKEIDAIVRAGFALGALSTGTRAFYATLGWERWRGLTFVASHEGVDASTGHTRTPGDDGDIMILRTPTTPKLDLDAPIVCDPRPGDVW